LKDFCTNRHEHEHNNNAEIDLTKLVPLTVTWDINKNNELKIRKEKLQAFIKAGSRIITRFRLLKRLDQIK